MKRETPTEQIGVFWKKGIRVYYGKKTRRKKTSWNHLLSLFVSYKTNILIWVLVFFPTSLHIHTYIYIYNCVDVCFNEWSSFCSGFFLSFLLHCGAVVSHIRKWSVVVRIQFLYSAFTYEIFFLYIFST